ncbi:Aste57867_1100 [Aphanomyces stellatus]|uniref:Aste57867_1100 protein n=1 Tax=Aphanomyces stellatus TaxID=120398 RepID=A0A485K9G1_9STRA|nr:hypothetical protein As57867_001099 [Aphanomyces stellatus]VFT78321.1 Aste57867_1100 [Aphanomyces stellatus]
MDQQPMQVQTPTKAAVAMAEPFQAVVEKHETLEVGAWKAGLCDCCDSVVPNCLCSTCCPCITFGQIVGRLGIGDCFVTSLVVYILCFTGIGALLFWLYLWYIRAKLRFFLSLPGSCVGDCLATLCCHCCVLAQMATHVGSYTPGTCAVGAKSTLPGYSSMLASDVQPLAVPVPDASQV